MFEFDDALENLMHDIAPELGFLSRAQLEETSFFKDFKARWIAGRRSEGAARGVETRRKNAAAGITQNGLKGSPRQKQWAAKIRGEFMKTKSDGAAAYMSAHGTSKMWIEQRTELRAVHYDVGRALARVADAAAALDACLGGMPPTIGIIEQRAEINAREALSLARLELRNLLSA